MQPDTYTASLIYKLSFDLTLLIKFFEAAMLSIKEKKYVV